MLFASTEQSSTDSNRSSTTKRPGGTTFLNERVARGFVLFILAFLVLVAGYVGYVKYDDLVEPNLPLFICCVPSALIASVLLFFALARRWTVVRRVERPISGSVDKRTEAGLKTNNEGRKPGENNQRHGARKIHRREIVHDDDEVSISGTSDDRKDEIFRKKKNLIEYMADLDEQFQDGLLMEDTYHSLKNKSNNELRELETLIQKGRAPRKK